MAKRKTLVEKPDEKYVQSCCQCLSFGPLLMMPIRAEGRLIGWVYACYDCFDLTKDQKVEIGRATSCRSDTPSSTSKSSGQ